MCLFDTLPDPANLLAFQPPRGIALVEDVHVYLIKSWKSITRPGQVDLDSDTLMCYHVDIIKLFFANLKNLAWISLKLITSSSFDIWHSWVPIQNPQCPAAGHSHGHMDSYFNIGRQLRVVRYARIMSALIHAWLGSGNHRKTWSGKNGKKYQERHLPRRFIGCFSCNKTHVTLQFRVPAGQIHVHYSPYIHVYRD